MHPDLEKAVEKARRKFGTVIDYPAPNPDQPPPASPDDYGFATTATTTRRGADFPLTVFSAIKLDTEQRGYLVKGLLPRRGLAVIWGPPKCGKSFWAMDVALHIALGWEYRGRRVQQASVVYVALEGRYGIPARIEAFKRHHGVAEAPFYLITAPLDLVKNANALIASIKSHLGDVRPGAVFIDTLNRSLIGSESKDEDMAAYIGAAGRVEEAFECLVPIVHHCGIDASRPRGHTSLTGAVEVQIEVKKPAAGQVVVKVERAKDFPEGDEIFSRLEVVELGTDPDGDDITTLVVTPGDAPTESAVRKPVRGAKGVALDLLRRAIDEAGAVPPASNNIPPNTRTISVETWRAYAYQGTITESDKPDTRRKAFVRAANELQAANLIGKWGDQVWLA